METVNSHEIRDWVVMSFSRHLECFHFCVICSFEEVNVFGYVLYTGG